MTTFEHIDYGLIRVSGQNATSFLQGQLTCDIAEVTEEQCRLAAYCNHKGRIQALFWILKIENDFLLALPQDTIPSTLSLLKKYGALSKITAEDVSQELKIVGMTGAASQNLIPYQVIQQNNTWLARLPGDTPHYFFITNDLAFPSTTSHLWHTENILAGLPQITLNTIGQFTPHDLNLPSLNAVNFKKGCYIGQEIVARMHYLGKLKQQMYRVTFSGIKKPLPGTELKNDQGQKIADIVDVCETTNPHQFIGLVVMSNTTALNKELALDHIHISLI